MLMFQFVVPGMTEKIKKFIPLKMVIWKLFYKFCFYIRVGQDWMFLGINLFPVIDILKLCSEASNSYLPFFTIKNVPCVTVQIPVSYCLRFIFFYKGAHH